MNRAICAALLFLMACIPIARERAPRIKTGSQIKAMPEAIPEVMAGLVRDPALARALTGNGTVYLSARQPARTQLLPIMPNQAVRFGLPSTGLGPSDSGARQEPFPQGSSVAGGSLPPIPVVSDEGHALPLWDVPVAVAGLGTPLSQVQAGKSTQIHIPGATAALSADSELVDVSATDGVVTVSGRAPGRAEVLVVTSDGVKSLLVLVSQAPPMYPPGFVPPVVAQEESGSYEFRYASEPRQLQNRYDFTTARPQRTTQLHLVNVDFFNGMSELTGNTNVDIPSGFFRIFTPRWSFTLLDDEVRNSPLTINDAIVRGIHFAARSWTVHAGISPLVTIYNVLIPTQKEAAFGISHEFKLSPHSELIQNAYYFPTHAQPYTAGTPGAVASLEYFLHRPGGLQILGEIGFSHGLGAAADFRWSNKTNFLEGSFRKKPREFASLSLGNLSGLVAELSWNRTITRKLLSFVTGSSNHILLPNGKQTNLTGTTNLQYKLSRNWSVSTGATYADFSQFSNAAAYATRSFNLPQEIDFDKKYFGAGFQYQFAKTSGSFSPGQDLRGRVRIGGNRLQLNAFAERQTQALSVTSLYSQIPALQIELQRMGLTAISPAQLSALLQDNAFLLSLGLAQQATLNLVPVRSQAGATLSLTSRGKRAQQLNLEFIENKQQLVQGAENNWIQSGSYTVPLTPSNEVSVSYSWFHYSALGQSQYAPQVTVGIKHNFSSLPSFFTPGTHGTISGMVFVDREMAGLYTPDAQALANVEIVLDGLTRTRTNEHGRYTFDHIPGGQHTVEAAVKSEQPFWFTTPSVVTTSIHRSTDFGITYAASELVGHVKNDAGLGVPDVEIDVTGPAGAMTAHTDADGRFALSGLRSGDYELVVDPNSVPPGHLLEELRPLTRWLENGIPKTADFLVRAMRTVLGQVSSYDAETGEYSPIFGATVSIPQLSLQATTDQQGKYTFRELPSGSFTLTVSDSMSSESRPISIPPSPVELQEDFRIQKRRRESEIR